MPAQDQWSRIEAHLKTRLRPDLFERWFAPLHPTRLEGDRLEISAPDKFHRDFVDDNYSSFFDEFVPDLLGRRLSVTFVVDAQRSLPRMPEHGPSLTPLPVPGSDGARYVERAPARRPAKPPLHLRYLRRRRIEPLRFAAAQAVASKPGQNYNPLFFHGDSGLGKTHLLHAIAHEIMTSRPGTRVAIVSSERYTNEFVEALSAAPGR